MTRIPGNLSRSVFLAVLSAVALLNVNPQRAAAEEAPSEAADAAKSATTEAAAGPRNLIEDAITRGVPVFNHDDHEQCATIYKVCLENLAGDKRIDTSMRKSLRIILARADATECERERAWTYRGALDSLYAHLDKSSR